MDVPLGSNLIDIPPGATAFQVTLEELVAATRSEARHYPKASLPLKSRGAVWIRKLLPDPIPGMELDRMELPPRAKMTGIPHTAGTREYLTCESGEIVLVASGEEYHLEAGDVVAFRGDQRHSYINPGARHAERRQRPHATTKRGATCRGGPA